MARSRRPGERGGRRRLTPYLFILPAFAVYAAFLLYPLARSIQLSLYDWDGLTLATFIGFGNYADIVGDERQFQAARGRTAAHDGKFTGNARS